MAGQLNRSVRQISKMTMGGKESVVGTDTPDKEEKYTVSTGKDRKRRFILKEITTPPMIAANDGRVWYALEHNPNHGPRAMEGLKDMKAILSYRPMYRKWVHARAESGDLREVERPIFHGYIFIGIEDGIEPDWLAIRGVNGIRRYVSVCGVPQTIPGQHLEALARKERDGAFEEVVHRKQRGPKVTIAAGTSVEILSGAFAGHVMSVDASNDDTVKLISRLLGGASIRMPVDSVRAIA